MSVLDGVVRQVMAHADFASKFRHPIKFNGTDFVETRLSEEEQFALLAKLAASTLHVFLERYGAMLQAADLRAVSKTEAAATPEAKFWLERLQQEPITGVQRQKRARRRRWAWARSEMSKAGGFFAEDVMKHRDPKLFFSLVGRHLKGTEKLSSAPMKGSLSSYLFQRLDQECNAAAAGSCTLSSGASEARSITGRAGETAGASCEASTADSRTAAASDTGGAGAGSFGSAERLDEDLLSNDAGKGNETENESEEEAVDDDDLEIDSVERRAKFLKTMRNRFVDGEEPGFNYKAIDSDSDLDDLVELGQDAEESYFDAE